MLNYVIVQRKSVCIFPLFVKCSIFKCWNSKVKHLRNLYVHSLAGQYTVYLLLPIFWKENAKCEMLKGNNYRTRIELSAQYRMLNRKLLRRYSLCPSQCKK